MIWPIFSFAQGKNCGGNSDSNSTTSWIININIIALVFTSCSFFSSLLSFL